MLLSGSAAEMRAATPLEEARTAMAAGDLAKADALLEPLAGAAGQDAAACHALSEVRLRQHRLPDAVALAERATTLDATKAEYFAQLGMALGQKMSESSFMEQAMLAGKLRRAFAKAVELDPNNVSGLIGLSRYYSNAPEIAGGSPAKARDYAARVQKLAPFQGELELAGVAERAENFADAAAHYDAATKLNPRHAWAQYRCGRALAKLGRKDEARMRFETAVKLDGNFDAAKKALAELEAPGTAK